MRAAPTRHQRVFVVEDSAPLRSRLRAMLEALPQVSEVGEAATVAEADRLLPDWHADVVVLDLRLPDGSGLAVLRFAKALPIPPSVVILTAAGDPVVRDHCLAAGADEFLVKTTQVSELPALVSRLDRVP